MDILAHALWANLAAELITRRRKESLTSRSRIGAMVGSIAPDLTAFAPYLFLSLFGAGNLLHYAWIRFGQEWLGYHEAALLPVYAIPEWVNTVYSYTHSGFLWVVIALALYLAVKRIPLWWVGWGTHIALDVFTHDADHFPTKLVYPLSDFHINATAWSNPVVLACTYVALLLCYLAVYTYRSRHSS